MTLTRQTAIQGTHTQQELTAGEFLAVYGVVDKFAVCCLSAVVLLWRLGVQHLFFGHSQAGDLRPYLCGYFDTTSGLKQEAPSYHNIQLSLGVDSPEEVRENGKPATHAY